MLFQVAPPPLSPVSPTVVPKVQVEVAVAPLEAALWVVDTVPAKPMASTLCQITEMPT